MTARGIHLTPADGVTATADADVTISIERRLDPRGRPRSSRAISGDVLLTQFEYARPINLTTDLSAFGGPAPSARSSRPTTRRSTR